MFDKLFGKTKYLVVEVEKPRQISKLDRNSQETVATLSSHPGFQWLMAKLRVQRSLLETQLKKGRHEDLRAVEFLQSGIFWSKWLEDQVSEVVNKVSQEPAQPAQQSEEAAFEEIQRAFLAVE